MKLKSITIVFENCEHITVYAEDVKTITLSGITETLSGRPDHIRISKNVRNVYLSIANNSVGLTQRLFKYNDITQLEFAYYDADSTIYHVDWGNSECYHYQNDRQSVCHFNEDLIWIRVDDSEKGEDV